MIPQSKVRSPCSLYFALMTQTSADEARVLALLEQLEQTLQENMLDSMKPCPHDKTCEQVIKVLSDTLSGHV